MMPSVFFFEDECEDKFLLGNKGANLVTMTKLGLPVPPGFIVSIEAYREYQRSGKLPLEELRRALSWLQKKTGKKLGDGLSVSVRSSAPASMPGMMDTVLNLKDEDKIISAVKRVFDSWDNLRAVEYRRLNKIPSDLGTSAIVQAMVLGNKEKNSGTGVVFTRNPNNGQKRLFGEYLDRAQGEDLVSGKRTPQPIETLRLQMPEVYAELERVADILERHFRDMQDVEFTVEDGKLYVLQTRSGKRSGRAAVRIAIDMVKEGIISPEEAILRLTPEDVRALLYKQLKPPVQYRPVAQGLSACPGAASGKVVFDPLEADTKARLNEAVILVRPETSPEDIQGIHAAEGVLTSRGGLTSHAAIVTRAMGKPCVCGAETLNIDLKEETLTIGDLVIRKGDEITIDGDTGNIYLGALPLQEAEATTELKELMSWADSYKRLGVWANADTVEMILQAKKFGAEGIGLCRTERQFNSPERLSAIREFILAQTPAERSEAINHLQRLQKEDFIDIFRALDGMPIIIRLLDMPLHEFLPSEEETTDPQVKERLRELREVNPMLGHRGVRVGVTFPEIYQMQIDAISEARAEVPANVAIMVPQVITVQELLWVKKYIKDPALKVGIMMETVRACMRAGKLAQEADFFSFGTNDLTQAVFSFSREDVERKFLTTYLELGILEHNPFQILDIKGVGRLMETAVSWARKEKKTLEIGVCGEHAGEPLSIRFFHRIGIDYVSCSPFRIPTTKLVAAQAALEQKGAPISAPSESAAKDASSVS
ncbi:MAG TPA: pyruvate, phosphate dikinase [Dehalococcoidia bacterium]|nr:pyruvate, phosphate dikinase [Dehalococcoidia bacterium]